MNSWQVSNIPGKCIENHTKVLAVCALKNTVVLFARARYFVGRTVLTYQTAAKTDQSVYTWSLLQNVAINCFDWKSDLNFTLNHKFLTIHKTSNISFHVLMLDEIFHYIYHVYSAYICYQRDVALSWCVHVSEIQSPFSLDFFFNRRV